VTRVVVTGSNRGIGLALCEAYSERGDEVLALCRRSTPELDALPVTVVEGIDLARDECMARLAELPGGRIDVVVCNAGVCEPSATFAELDLATVENELQVNALGSVRVVKALLSRLGEGSKIALIGSNGGLLETPLAGNYGYRMSKAAQAMFGIALADEVSPLGIAVVVLAPGATWTDLLQDSMAVGGFKADRSQCAEPIEAARGLQERIDELRLETTGRWLQRTGEVLFAR
jgi:NAD(P)-dependent dehydrogenase (short-subunit alcohol dehydrogenase family)